MSNFDDDLLLGRLKRLAEVKPDPDATRRALDRVRQLLAAEHSRPPLSVRMIMLRRLAIAAVILLAAGGALFWLLPSPAPAGATFVQVQAAMKSSRSVSCRQVVHAEGQPGRTTRLWALDNGLWRAEESDGSYSITDNRKYRALAVSPKERKALLLEGMNTPNFNFYELLKNLTGDASARPLPGKKMNGKDVLGFIVKVDAHDFTIWADARTRLPFRIELQEDDAGKTGSVVIDDFVFDKEMDASLFSFEPPAGFKLETRGNGTPLPAAPSELDLKSPVVTPLVGIGPVKFGMSRAEVEKLLGKPDFVEERGKSGYVDMSYGSRGFFIGVGKTLGVVIISCVAQKTMATRVHDFTGKTDKGIALGSSQAAVIKAYGEPARKEKNMGSTYLSYAKIQADFTFYGDELVQMMFTRQRQAKP
jgi:hypothetical protein